MNGKFSDRIKELRIEKGLSQGALATALKYTQSNISEWEQGKVEPKISALRAIANFFNVSIDYLAGRTDDLGAVVMPGAVQLSEVDKEILKKYHALRSDLKEVFWITLNALGSNPSTTKKKA